MRHPAPHMPLGASDRTGRKLYREGTHRTDAPVHTLARVRPHMAAMGITRIANLTGLDRLGIPVVSVFRPNSRSVAVAQGKGLHLDAAKASGLMEAVETFHAETIGAARTASLEALRRDARVIDISRLPRVPETELPPDQPVPWVRAEDWVTGEPLFVPYEVVSTDYTLPLPPGTGYFQANTNGLASGNCVLEAVLHGVCELIERDATASVVGAKPRRQGGAHHRSRQRRRSRVPMGARAIRRGRRQGRGLGYDDRHRGRVLSVRGLRTGPAPARARRRLSPVPRDRAAACAHRSRASQDHGHLRLARRSRAPLIRLR